MIKTIITSILTSLAVSVLALSFISSPTSNVSTFGSQIETILVQLGGGVNIGGSGIGTSYSLVKSGTCTLLTDASIAATSTKNFDCAIPASGAFTGIKSGDIVRMSLAASTTLASQYVIKSAQASSTTGWATVQLLNLTGGAAVPSATNGFGSSTVYQLFRPI